MLVAISKGTQAVRLCCNKIIQFLTEAPVNFVVVVVRPHRSTMYVDAACCYRPIVWSVGQSVCQSVTLVSSAETVEPIEMSFGFRTGVGSGNHVLDGGPDPPWEEAILRGEMSISL